MLAVAQGHAETAMTKREQFITDCVAAGYSHPERRWEICQAYDSATYDNFDKYQISLHCTEDEWDLMEELGITYDD